MAWHNGPFLGQANVLKTGSFAADSVAILQKYCWVKKGVVSNGKEGNDRQGCTFVRAEKGDGFSNPTLLGVLGTSQNLFDNFIRGVR